MFSPQTKVELTNALIKANVGLPVTLTARAFKELLEAAHISIQPQDGGAASISFQEQPDGSLKIVPGRS